MRVLFLTGFILCSITVFAQQTYYDVIAGNGNGIRFWQHDAYKIHMGNSSEYLYGPVTDFSIKMNMSGDVGRGWTWGIWTSTPVAALNNVGDMQIAGKFTVTGNSNPFNFTSSWSFSPDNASNVSEISNDAVNYRQLMIVGNKAQGADRRVGIWDRLSIHGAGFSQTFNVNGTSYFSDNVGIGTTQPVTTLDVNGGISIQNNNNLQWGGAFGPGIPTISAAVNSGLYFYPSGSTSGVAVRIHPSGFVGIGTSSPDTRLTVKGTVHAEEVKVDLNVPAPDFVFESNYRILPLEELKKFIDANKHLPEVPSAKEMEQNGVKLGEMNMILLKKVEELTLYVIELKKENSQLRKEVLDKMAQLESMISAQK